ncbi:DMT family transporter [Sphingomonas canadensis]|uniref:DMT family transporter n=1 Tax=Sphingomonas canadensis TaxID=1219257 RepID=A0ABW3H6Q8_9SPHN|nr:DMT family transporter [Sphingomonas canadensis]MCW3836738.1 DMT family transporter [Sphingomonas canadensis]
MPGGAGTGPQRAPRSLLALAALVLVMLMWAGNSFVGRAVRADIPPFLLAFVRWTGALLVVLPFAARHLRRDWPAMRAGWLPLLLIGFFGIVCFNALLYSGLRYTTAANALLLQAGVPPLVLLADRLFFGRRATGFQILAVLTGGAGVAVVVCQGSLTQLLALHFGAGDLIILCAVVAWALYTSLLRLRPAIHPTSLLAVTFAIGVAGMAPLAASEWAEIAAMHWRPELFGAFAYVAVFPSVVAYALYNAAVAEVGPALSGQAISLLPLFGALLAVPLLGEALHGYHAVGMALIAAGIAAGWFAGKPGAA